MAEAAVSTRSLTKNDWPVIERLFGRRGACGGCWCMYWRVPSTGRNWQEQKGEPNRRAFEELVRSGGAHGVLAFRGAEPVGWCSIGPRGDFPYLARARYIPPPPGKGTWSVTCFFVAREARNRGIALKLLKEAVRHAREAGADEIEAYPSVVRTRERLPDAFAHTGVPPLFERAGFRKAAEAGSRLVYRLPLWMVR